MSKPRTEYVYLGDGKGAEIVYYGDPERVTLRDGSEAEVRPIHTVRVGGMAKLYLYRPDTKEGD